MSIVIILLSLMSWIPGLLLFLLQSYLEGWTWFTQNIPIASAIFMGSLVWILLLALMTQAISAWVRWRVASRAALLAAFFIPSTFAAIVNEIFQTSWANIFSLQALFEYLGGIVCKFQRRRFSAAAVGRELPDMVTSTAWAAWLVLFLI